MDAEIPREVPVCAVVRTAANSCCQRKEEVMDEELVPALPVKLQDVELDEEEIEALLLLAETQQPNPPGWEPSPIPVRPRKRQNVAAE
jgi:hypothetical protein